MGGKTQWVGLIAAALTWYVAVGLLPWEYVGWDLELAPLYDAAKITGSPFLETVLFVGTLFSAVASANGRPLFIPGR